MKKEWLLGEKSCRTKHQNKSKRHHSSSPTIEEIERKGQESTSKEIRLSKEMFQTLVKKARMKTFEPPKTRCMCTCTCGFYPVNTRLIAEINYQQQDMMKFIPNITPDVCVSQPTIARLTAEPLQPFDPSTMNPINHVPQPRLPTHPYGLYPTQPVQDTVYLQEYMAGMSTLSSSNQPGPSTGPSAFRRYDNFIPTDPSRLMSSLNDYTFFDQTNKSFNGITDLPLFNNTIPPSLSGEDRTLVQELIQANYLLTMPMNFAAKGEGELSLVDIVRISDLAMRRIITMAKKLHMFMSQMQSDQIAILKGSLSELLILRGVMVFDPTQDIWKHQIYTGSKELKISVDILRKTPEQKHYAEHKKFLMSFDEKWRKNENVMLILNAITLFCPDRPNIKDVNKVKACQRQYYDLLKRFVNIKAGILIIFYILDTWIHNVPKLNLGKHMIPCLGSW